MKCTCCKEDFPVEEMTLCEGEYYCPVCADVELIYCSRCGVLLPLEYTERTRFGYLCDECYHDLLG